MSNSLWVTLVEAEPLTGRHAGEHGIEVTAHDMKAMTGSSFSAVGADDFLIEHLEEIREMAAKSIAGARVEYPEGGGSDSDYLNRIDAFADHFYLKDVKVTGMDRRLYEVDAQYSDGQPWTDNVEACDEMEAMFQARMELARLEGWDVVQDVKDGRGAASTTSELVSHLCDFEIFTVQSVADLPVVLLGELVELAEAGNVDEIVEKLKTEGRRIIGGNPQDYASPSL